MLAASFELSLMTEWGHITGVREGYRYPFMDESLYSCALVSQEYSVEEMDWAPLSVASSRMLFSPPKQRDIRSICFALTRRIFSRIT